jgi:hypothetical protein
LLYTTILKLELAAILFLRFCLMVAALITASSQRMRIGNIDTRPAAPVGITSPTTRGIPRVGDDVFADGFRWRVAQAVSRGSRLLASDSRCGTLWESDERTSGRFFCIEVNVENVSMEVQKANSPKIVDSADRRYEENIYLDCWHPESRFGFLLDYRLNPNVTRNFAAMYELPEIANGLKLNVSTNNPHALIDLGQ